MKGLRKRIRNEGREVGRGSEAVLYLVEVESGVEKSVWKVFDNCSVSRRECIRRNVEFLVKYSHTGVVPKFRGFAFVEKGLIKMEYLGHGYLTLYDYCDTKWYKTSPEARNELLSVLWSARILLPNAIEFTDFKNPRNIMIQHSVEGTPLRAVFLEGGNEIPNTTNAAFMFVQYLIETEKRTTALRNCNVWKVIQTQTYVSKR